MASTCVVCFLPAVMPLQRDFRETWLCTTHSHISVLNSPALFSISVVTPQQFDTFSSFLPNTTPAQVLPQRPIQQLCFLMSCLVTLHAFQCSYLFIDIYTVHNFLLCYRLFTLQSVFQIFMLSLHPIQRSLAEGFFCC